MVAGVCAGIAQRWGFDLTLVRIITVVLTLVSGVGLAVYLAAWLLTPSSDGPAPLRPDSRLAQSVGRTGERLGRRLPGLIVIIIAAIVIVALAHAVFSGLWLGAPVGLLAFLLVLGLILGTRRGRWLLLGLVLLVLIPLTTLAAFGSHFGARSYTVASLGDLHDHYDFGAGTVKLDLSSLTTVTGRHETNVRVGSGDVTVTVPPGAAVVVHGQSGLGSVTIDGHKVSGIDAEQTRAVGNDPAAATSEDRLVVDVRVGLGDIKVKTSG